jgi:hypothetical protein
MSRLFALLVLALAPLLASAHGGHHAAAPQEAAPAETNGSVAAAAAPSRCPGGGHEDCCCHDGWCTTGCATLAVIDAPSRQVPQLAAEASIAFAAQAALRSAALLRFPARGPPALS